MKATFVDTIKESTSMSIKPTFEILIIEIDIGLYQCSCVDLIKWQEEGKILVQVLKLSSRPAESVYKRQDNNTRIHVMQEFLIRVEK